MTTPVWCWTHRLQKDLLIGFQYCSHLGEEPAMLAEIGQRIRIIQWIDLRSQKKSIFFYFGRSWLFYLFRGLQEGEHLQESISETTIFTCRCSCWPILGNHIGEVAELSFSSFSLSWCFLILYSRLAGSGWIITHSIIMQNPQGKTNKQTEKSKQTNKQTTKQPNNLTIKQTVYTTTKCVFFFLKPNFWNFPGIQLDPTEANALLWPRSHWH